MKSEERSLRKQKIEKLLRLSISGRYNGPWAEELRVDLGFDSFWFDVFRPLDEAYQDAFDDGIIQPGELEEAANAFCKALVNLSNAQAWSPPSGACTSKKRTREVADLWLIYKDQTREALRKLYKETLEPRLKAKIRREEDYMAFRINLKKARSLEEKLQILNEEE